MTTELAALEHLKTIKLHAQYVGDTESPVFIPFSDTECVFLDIALLEEFFF